MSFLFIFMAVTVLWAIIASLKPYIDRNTKSSKMKDGLKRWALGDYSKRAYCASILKEDLPGAVASFCIMALDMDASLGLYPTVLTGTNAYKPPDNMTRLSGFITEPEVDLFFGHQRRITLNTHDDTNVSVEAGEALFVIAREQKLSGKTKKVTGAAYRYNRRSLPYLGVLLEVMKDASSKPIDKAPGFYEQELIRMLEQHPEEAARYASDPVIGSAARGILVGTPK